MPDQLRERFDALRNAVEGSDAAGLHDVRVRRTRRARTRVAAGTVLAVAGLALGGVVVLPQLGPDATTSAGGAEVLDASGEAPGADPSSPTDQAAEQAPVDESVTDPPPDEVPPPDADQGPFSLTVDSLLTWEEILAVGETGPGALPYGASLVFPPLDCGAGSSYEQYSGPAVVYSAAWALSDGRLDQAVIEYESDQQAAEALARLVQDSQACSVFSESASIQFVSADASVGAEIAFFDLLLESGPDGSPSTAEVTVTRVANVLVEVVLTPDGATVTDADTRSRALAGAGVSRIVAIG